MRHSHAALVVALAALALLAGGCSSGGGQPDHPALVVNSLEDAAAPPSGTVTLRSAIEAAGPGAVRDLAAAARDRAR